MYRFFKRFFDVMRAHRYHRPASGGAGSVRDVPLWQVERGCEGAGEVRRGCAHDDDNDDENDGSTGSPTSENEDWYGIRQFLKSL